jgi:hypothetical protein
MVANGKNNKNFMSNSYNMLYIFLIISFPFLQSCNEMKQQGDTPKEFLSHTIMEKGKYASDSAEITRHLRTLLGNHEGFFYSKAYFDFTELIIDSIVYSPDFNKLAVLVITKNPTYRQLIPDKVNDWYYDATCYLGVRKNDTMALYWIGPSFTNSSNKESISSDISESCFKAFVTKDTNDVYSYNLNDNRFWSSSIWNKIEEEKRKKKNFEEDKKSHPENIYEPKRN